MQEHSIVHNTFDQTSNKNMPMSWQHKSVAGRVVIWRSECCSLLNLQGIECTSTVERVDNSSAGSLKHGAQLVAIDWRPTLVVGSPVVRHWHHSYYTTLLLHLYMCLYDMFHSSRLTQCKHVTLEIPLSILS